MTSEQNRSNRALSHIRSKKESEATPRKRLRSDSVFYRIPSPALFDAILALLADEVNADGEQSVGFEEFNRLNFFPEVRDEFMLNIHGEICKCIRPQHIRRRTSELSVFEDFVVVLKDMAMVHPRVSSMKRKKHRLIFTVGASRPYNPRAGLRPCTPTQTPAQTEREYLIEPLKINADTQAASSSIRTKEEVEEIARVTARLAPK